MPVFIVCPACGSEYSVKHKSCPKCGAVRPTGPATYRIHVTHNYKTVKKHFSGITLTHARKIEIRIKQTVIENEYFFESRKIPFSLYFEKKYLPYAKEKKSYDRETVLYKYWIKPVIGAKNITSVSPLDIEKIKRTVLEAGRSPRTAEYAMAVVRQAYNKAIDWGIFSGKNPVSSVKSPKKDNKRLRFLTKEESNRLLEALHKRSQTVYEIAFVSLYTGMRFGEIVGLTWQDIDFENGIINIKDPKNNTGRAAYMTRHLKEMLMSKKERDKPQNPKDSVFRSVKGGKIGKVSRSFSRTVKELGLNDGVEDRRDKVVFHTLRHTFASWLAINGTPIYTIKELMGHKSLAMTERYSHLIPDIKREAVEKVFSDDEEKE